MDEMFMFNWCTVFPKGQRHFGRIAIPKELPSLPVNKRKEKSLLIKKNNVYV